MIQTDLLPKEQRSAVFSDCRRYRYTLRIVWDPALPLCQFIGLNPSTADEHKDDPTLRRVKAFARSWGYGGVIMTNLFAWRDTLPKNMKRAVQPIGEPMLNHMHIRGHVFTNRNDSILLRVAEQCLLSIAAWGNHGAHLKREEHVKILLPRLRCLRLTGAGHPEHPLYMPSNTLPIDFP
jgi:hypothetical protein